MDGRERLGSRIESGRGALGMRVPEQIELRHTKAGMRPRRPLLVVGLWLRGAIEDDAAVEDRDGHLSVEDLGRVRAEERG